jgi:glycosyltransferase involved in cell wall biosynthesis
MPRISIVTITARPGFIGDAVRSLKKQTFQDFEWIIVDKLFWERREQVKEYMKDKGITYLHLPDKLQFIEHPYKLNNALNTGLLFSRGELIIWWQDFIKLYKNSVKDFWEIHKEKGPCLMTAADERVRVQEPDNPDDMIDLWKGEPKIEEVELDCWRKEPKAGPVVKYTDEKHHRQFELNWAATSTEIMKDLGGYDEDFDEGFNFDNNWMGLRALRAGYPLYFLQDSLVTMYNHWTLFKHNEKYQKCCEDRHEGVKRNQQLFDDKANRKGLIKMLPFHLKG